MVRNGEKEQYEENRGIKEIEIEKETEEQKASMSDPSKDRSGSGSVYFEHVPSVRFQVLGSARLRHG